MSRSYGMWWSGASAVICGSDSSLMNNQEMTKVPGRSVMLLYFIKNSHYLTSPFMWSQKEMQIGLETPTKQRLPGTIVLRYFFPKPLTLPIDFNQPWT